MKIAHLIMAHQDPKHIVRLANRLSDISDIYIHIDKSVDICPFAEGLSDNKNVTFLDYRFHCEWGGWHAVEAEIELIRTALMHADYDRLVLLQGADYPLKSNEEIAEFFDENRSVEFIRGCSCTNAGGKLTRSKCYIYWMFNNRNILKKIWNNVCFRLGIELRDGFAKGNGLKHEVFWGCAQWAVTGSFAQYVVDFFQSNAEYNHWYYHAFPADEIYFTTVVMNSAFRENTTAGGPEPEKEGLTNWRNLHYFEYPPGSVTVFNEEDYERLKGRPELYIRKVNSETSGGLLDLLDKG